MRSLWNPWSPRRPYSRWDLGQRWRSQALAQIRKVRQENRLRIVEAWLKVVKTQIQQIQQETHPDTDWDQEEMN
jgi:hypothetical protein